MIKKCIAEVSTAVEKRRKLRAADIDDLDALKLLRKEQTKVRYMLTTGSCVQKI
jgi:ribosomal protein L29